MGLLIAYNFEITGYLVCYFLSIYRKVSICMYALLLGATWRFTRCLFTVLLLGLYDLLLIRWRNSCYAFAVVFSLVCFAFYDLLWYSHWIQDMPFKGGYLLLIFFAATVEMFTQKVRFGLLYKQVRNRIVDSWRNEPSRSDGLFMLEVIFWFFATPFVYIFTVIASIPLAIMAWAGAMNLGAWLAVCFLLKKMLWVSGVLGVTTIYSICQFFYNGNYVVVVALGAATIATLVFSLTFNHKYLNPITSTLREILSLFLGDRPQHMPPPFRRILPALLGQN